MLLVPRPWREGKRKLHRPTLSTLHWFMVHSGRMGKIQNELLPSLFRKNFYFYFFRLASELQQPAASYAAGGWGREEESQFIKFYFAVENVPVALKHFIKKSFRL